MEYNIFSRINSEEEVMSKEKSELLALSIFNNNQEPDLIKNLFESIELDEKDRVKELLTRNPELATKRAQFTEVSGLKFDMTPLEYALCRTPGMFDVMRDCLSPNESDEAMRIKSQYLEQRDLSNFSLDSFYEAVRAYNNAFNESTVEEREAEYKKVDSQLPERFRQPAFL